MSEFPKMIYRPQAAPNAELGGQKMETLVVNSASEALEAARRGWCLTLAEAIEQVKNNEKRIANKLKLRAILAHPAIRVAGAVALALLIAFLTKLLGLN